VAAVAAALLVTACGSAAPQAPTESDPARFGPARPLEAVVQRVVEAGPGRNSADYRPPRAPVSEALAEIVTAQLTGDDAPPAPDGVGVREAVDGAGRPARIVVETVSDGRTTGLGLYAVRAGTGVPPGIVVEVPHPRADLGTEDLGVELFSALEASALLVAGAHRTAGDGAADVAHQPASAFAVVDRAVVGSGTVVLQVHGFDEAGHDSSADVVLSSGDRTASAVVQRLDRELQDAGFDTCVYDGENCAALAATRNVQAAHAREVGASFAHLELARSLREPGADRDALVAAVVAALAR
jgi:hypothetical protein